MTKYKPSNGTERMIFIENWCSRCQKDAAFQRNHMDTGCEILALTFSYDPEDKEYPKEWILNENGKHICTAFKQEILKHTEPPKTPEQVTKEAREKEVKCGQLRMV